MALNRIVVNGSTSTVQALLSLPISHKYRHHQIEVPMAQGVIKSVYQGVPLGTFLLNVTNRHAHRMAPPGVSYVPITGSMRIAALDMFKGNQFGVPSDWFKRLRARNNPAHSEMLGAGLATFDMLEQVDQDRLLLTTVQVYQMALTEAQEEELAQRIHGDTLSVS